MILPNITLISLLVIIVVSHYSPSSALRISSFRKCPDHGLANGIVIPKANGRSIKYRCLYGFKLFGERTGMCIRGAWEYQVQKPVCVRLGCTKIPPLLNGNMQAVDGFNGAVLTFACDPGYTLTSTPTIFCNSRAWNATIPQCISNVTEASTSCDFENGDLCGWSHDTNHNFDWTRYTGPTPSTSVSTGPSWDHTKGKGGSGYYMYIESSSPRMENDTARLISPVFPSELSSDACFIFYYHMFGQTIGTLNVYLKPEGQPRRPKIFSVSGQQGNKWVRAIAKFDPLDENFQIVIEGVRGSSYLGDSAIDDVRLANETDCDPTVTTTDFSADTSVPLDTDVSQSCRMRCFTAPPSTGDAATVESQLDANETVALSYCECHAWCVANNTCCEDFDDYCIEAKTSPTPASATTFHRTVASFPYSPPNASVLQTVMPPLSSKPPASPSSIASPMTSPNSPSTAPTSAPGPSRVSRPTEKPITLAQPKASSSAINNTSSGTTTITPKPSASNPPTTKTSPARTSTMNFSSTAPLSVSSNPITPTLSSVTTSSATKGTVVPTKTTMLLTESTTVPSKSTSVSSKSTIAPTKLTSPPTKSTNPPTKSTSVPTKSTNLPTKQTAAPTKLTYPPTKQTNPPTQSTAAVTKATAVTRRILPSFTWDTRGKPTTKSTPSWASETSTTYEPPPPPTTSKVSAKTNDKENSADVKEMIAKETSYLQNSQLLKERPAKNQGKTWQMAQRAPPSHGLTPLALYSGLAAGLCVVLAVVAATSVFLLRRRRTKLRRRFDDDSEVRFLTADEILDFTIAQPKDDM